VLAELHSLPCLTVFADILAIRNPLAARLGGPMNPYEAPASKPRGSPKLRRRLIICVVLLVYVSTYIALSRRGFAKADAIDLQGMWFATPEDGENWRFFHYPCVLIYAPLIAIDNLIGTGRSITSEPIWDLADCRSGGQQCIAAEARHPCRARLRSSGNVRPFGTMVRCS
jgi:hypothetical protein